MNGFGRNRTFRFRAIPVYDSIAYDPVKTRFLESEAEAEKPTNRKAQNRALYIIGLLFLFCFTLVPGSSFPLTSGRSAQQGTKTQGTRLLLLPHFSGIRRPFFLHLSTFLNYSRVCFCNETVQLVILFYFVFKWSSLFF